MNFTGFLVGLTTFLIIGLFHPLVINPRMNSYCNYLHRKGYEHEYYVSPGGHQWYNWKEYNNMFMKKL